MSWAINFGIMGFALVVCPAIVFAYHLSRLKNEKNK